VRGTHCVNYTVNRIWPSCGKSLESSTEREFGFHSGVVLRSKTDRDAGSGELARSIIFSKETPRSRDWSTMHRSLGMEEKIGSPCVRLTQPKALSTVIPE